MDSFTQNVQGFYLTADIVYAVRKPERLTRDERGRLHNEDASAIRWRNGDEFFFWHGIRVKEDVILRPDTITKEQIFNEPNMEIRRAMIEKIGYERFIGMTGSEIMHVDGDYRLLRVDFIDVDNKRVKILEMKCPSTGRIYFLRVPPHCVRCKQAVAWSFSEQEADYMPQQES